MASEPRWRVGEVVVPAERRRRIATVLHVLAHLPATAGGLGLRAPRRRTAARTGLVLGALVAGLIVALVLAPDIAPWMHAHRRG